MPIVILRKDIENTIAILRIVEQKHTGDIQQEAKRLAHLYERQLDPNTLIITDTL